MASGGVHKLAWQQFDQFVRRTPVVLLAVSDVNGPKVPNRVTAFFSGIYGEQFAAAAISVSDVPYRRWLVERLQPARSSFTFADGLYLFLGGKPAKYHQGYNLAGQLAELAVLLVSDGRFSHEGELHAQEILDLFGPVAAEFMRCRGQAPPSIAASPPSAEQQARQLLGVAAGASDREIDKAWKTLRAAYAPDKVQHVSKEFVQLASEKVIAIDQARDVLRGRGGKA